MGVVFYFIFSIQRLQKGIYFFALFFFCKGVYIGNCGTDWTGVKDLTQLATGDMAK